MVWHAAQFEDEPSEPLLEVGALLLHDGDPDALAGGEGLDECGDLEGLLAVEARWLTGGLYRRVLEGHTTGRNPEVDRAGSQALEIGRPARALGRRAVAGRAVGREQHLSRVHERPREGHVGEAGARGGGGSRQHHPALRALGPDRRRQGRGRAGHDWLVAVAGGRGRAGAQGDQAGDGHTADQDGRTGDAGGQHAPHSTRVALRCVALVAHLGVEEVADLVEGTVPI